MSHSSDSRKEITEPFRKKQFGSRPFISNTLAYDGYKQYCESVSARGSGYLGVEAKAEAVATWWMRLSEVDDENFYEN